MEPLLISEGSRHRGPLADLAVDLAARAAGLRRSLRVGVGAALADLVRAMSCYYSNLIEGHDIHPVDIERAFKNDYSNDARKRDLQLEARAHISVQRWIDGGGLRCRAVSAATAHHRLLWIHPFLDGNGRVARLMPHAMLLESLDTGGLWSVARGLARNVAEYKRRLASCDLPRRNDFDGRGALSEEELAMFTQFMIEECIDQVEFMERLVQPERLRTRILLWAEEEVRMGVLPAPTGQVIEAILYRGELPRADVSSALGTTARHARRIVSALADRGVLVSEGPRAPWRLAFPAALASRWMPGLFPERAT